VRIEFRNVHFAYQPNLPVLSDISFELQTGEFLLILGQNGAGKSTLLKLLNGILKPTGGSVLVDGYDTASNSTASLARHVCVTFQNPADQLFASTVRRELEFAPRNLKRPDATRLVEEALSLCELGPSALQHPYDLPPAQRKVLTVASALASGSPFLAFDEPSAGLSQLERRVLDNLTRSLRANERGLLVVSHDLELFLPYASNVLLLRGGTRTFLGKPEQLLREDMILEEAGLRLPTLMRLRKDLGLPLLESAAGDPSILKG
jgi:energy-coupling factor transporter ATP-binding protein EcfA2